MVSSDVRSEIDKSNTQYGRFGQGSTLKSRAAGADSMASAKKVTDQSVRGDENEDEGQMTVDGVYNELIHLRKINRVLGDRIKQLEV